MFLLRNRSLLHWSIAALSSVLSVAPFPLGGRVCGTRGALILLPQSLLYQLPGAFQTCALTCKGTPDDDEMTENGTSSDALPTFEDDNDIQLLGDEEDEYCELVDEFGALAVERFCENGEGDEFRWIRLEKQPDKSIEKVSTRQDVLKRMHLASKAQAEYGKATLFARRWKHIESGTLNGYAVDGSDSSSFTVCQFNTLAEGLSAGPDATRPFEVDNVYGQSEKSIFGGFTNVAHPEIALDFSLRRWRLLEVILGKNGACPFDIVALEEVDRFYGFFAPLMRLFGYEGIFIPKTRSPSVRMGWYSDGCSLFWKGNMFELLSERRVEYKVGSQVLLLALLKHIPTQQMMLVTVTHLKAQRSEANEMVRCAQVEELAARIKEELAIVVDRYKVPTIPVLVMGDFNADAPSQTEGASSAIRNLLHSNISPNDIPCALRSAYDIDPPEENFYTTWKTRGTTTSKRIIDYIFYGGNLSCQAHLAVPDPDNLGDAKLPSLQYPSDHMAIAAKFELK